MFICFVWWKKCDDDDDDYCLRLWELEEAVWGSIRREWASQFVRYFWLDCFLNVWKDRDMYAEMVWFQQCTLAKFLELKITLCHFILWLRIELGHVFSVNRFCLVWQFRKYGKLLFVLIMVSFFIDLQYYMRTGTCKFGVSCKYHHPKQGGGSVSSVLLNYYGYPLRPVCITWHWRLIF